MSEEKGYQEAQAVGGFFKRHWVWLGPIVGLIVGFVIGKVL